MINHIYSCLYQPISTLSLSSTRTRPFQMTDQIILTKNFPSKDGCLTTGEEPLKRFQGRNQTHERVGCYRRQRSNALKSLRSLIINAALVLWLTIELPEFLASFSVVPWHVAKQPSLHAQMHSTPSHHADCIIKSLTINSNSHEYIIPLHHFAHNTY